MSANIQLRDVQVGNEMAWHKLTVIEPNITSENCRIRYDMSIEPIYFRTPAGDYAEANGRQIVASDDGLPVGKVVGKDYKLISNSEVWDSVQNGLGGTKHKIVSCGTVDNRALGFVSIKIAEDFHAANRNTQAVMNVLWGHGGNKAVIARTGFTVVVCQNTFNMAMSERSDFKLSIRHTSKANVLDLGKAIDAHIGVTAEFQKAMNELNSVDASPTTARKVYTGFLCDEEVPETKTGISRLSNTVDDMVSLFQRGKGNAGRTMADVFNGATDYYSHESSGGRANAWKQFNSSEFGSGDKRKSEFFEVLTNPDALAATVRQGEKVLLALGI
jgi:hypothetical protein